MLAVVGKEHITAEEFGAELARRSEGFPEAYSTPEQRARLLDEMIRTKAALAKARASGFEREPATRALIEKLIASRFEEREFAKWSATNPPLGEAEINSYYETRREQFRVPAAVRAGVVSFKVSSKAAPAKRLEIRAKAEAIRAQASTADEAGFIRLVQQHSEDQSSRYTGGDTGWLRKGESSQHWPEAVVNAVFALEKPGEVAPVIESANGFFVVRLTGRRETDVRPLAEVRDAVRYQLQQARRQKMEREFAAALKRGLDIQTNQDVFKSISPPKSGLTSAPPAMPGG